MHAKHLIHKAIGQWHSDCLEGFVHIFYDEASTMIKKILALAATAVFSLNASAGYVQYNFNAGGLSGFIVQHDTDGSIALFDFQLADSQAGYGQQFAPFAGEGSVLLTGAWTSSLNGPTSFSIHDTFGHDHVTDLRVTFGVGPNGLFTYTASYTADLYANMPPAMYTGSVSGLASGGTVDEMLASYLDQEGGYAFGVPRIVPTLIAPNDVPEPAGIALLALGAAGMAGIARRRKPAR